MEFAKASNLGTSRFIFQFEFLTSTFLNESNQNLDISHQTRNTRNAYSKRFLSILAIFSSPQKTLVEQTYWIMVVIKFFRMNSFSVAKLQLL